MQPTRVFNENRDETFKSILFLMYFQLISIKYTFLKQLNSMFLVDPIIIIIGLLTFLLIELVVKKVSNVFNLNQNTT